MGLLDEFEKLINEHGSAVILKERIALANDKYEALERKATEFENKNKQLVTENKQLAERVRAFEQAAAQRDGERLESIREEILHILSKERGLKAVELAQNLSVSLELVQFHLTDLEEHRLVYPEYDPFGDAGWSLDQEGRRYLVRYALLS